MGRRIVITSGKGGVGKTTVAFLLGRELARGGARVLLIDADTGLNNLDVLAGVEEKITFDVLDVIDGKCRARQAIVPCAEGGLFLLPSVRFGGNLKNQSVRAITESLADSFDFILLDSPAGLGAGFERAVSGACEGIVVTTPQLPALRDADKVLGILREFGLLEPMLVVNRVRGDLIARSASLDVNEITGLLSARILGVLPEDDRIAALCESGESMTEIPSAKLLAENLEFGREQVFDCTERYRGLFGGIRRYLKGIV